MMTTKVFQRVLAIFLVVAAIFFSSAIVNARTFTSSGITINGKELEFDIPDKWDSSDGSIKLYDNSVENILSGIRELVKNYNIMIRGTHYYIGKDGFRYCESRFDENDEHRLIFKVNSDGSVSSALIITPLYTLSGEYNNSGEYNSGVLCGAVCAMAGMNGDQIVNLANEIGTWRDAYHSNPRKSSNTSNNTFSVWCDKSNRYIDLNLFGDNTYNFMNVLIYAHK